ncbi:MAG: cyclase family protein [Actinobacteria bacterium]|nr:cyclase family protein [Actinomycetota bacterium]
MPVRIIDLSLPLEDSPSEPLPIRVVHEDHSQSVEMACRFFGCSAEDLPGGLAWANDRLEIHAHAGTHVDAPWHYAPVSEGKKARSIDEMPLEWFFGDGVVLDMRWKERGSEIRAADLEVALAKLGYELKAGDIVLIQTGADKLWGTKEYFDAGCGMGRESTLWLLDRGIRVMGIDAWGWDRPFWAIREEFQRTADPSCIWAAHYVGREREYCHIEKLANLDLIPVPHGFKVACFPIKLVGGSAGLCRPVAILESD